MCEHENVKAIHGIVLLSGLCLFALAGCGKPITQPVRTLQVGRRATLMTCGGWLVACSESNPGRIVQMWQWSDLAAYPKVEISRWDSVILGKDTILLHEKQGKDSILVAKDLRKGQEKERWSLGETWYCDMLGVSRNGRFSVVLAKHQREALWKVGVLEADSLELKWLAEYPFKYTSWIRAISISESGKRIVVIGANESAHAVVLDAQTGAQISEVNAPGTAGLSDGAFSNSDDCIYASAESGHIVRIDPVKGSQLMGMCNEGGKPIYGVSAARISISPDGSMAVVSVLGGDDSLYVWDLSSGRLRQVITPGKAAQCGSQRACISRDSKFIAISSVLNGGVINIFDVK